MSFSFIESKRENNNKEANRNNQPEEFLCLQSLSGEVLNKQESTWSALEHKLVHLYTSYFLPTSSFVFTLLVEIKLTALGLRNTADMHDYYTLS